jgi:hypothetical protein
MTEMGQMGLSDFGLSTAESRRNKDFGASGVGNRDYSKRKNKEDLLSMDTKEER